MSNRNFALLLIAVLGVVLWLLMLTFRAPAHDGRPAVIPSGCCGATDCEIVSRYISMEPGGYRVRYKTLVAQGGNTWAPVEIDELVPFNEATPIEGEDFWRCHMSNGGTRSFETEPAKWRKCFFAPYPKQARVR